MTEEQDQTSNSKPSEQAENEEQISDQGNKREIKEPKKPYTTAVNDPDLLVGPYKPIEGEPLTIKCPNCGEEMPTTIDTCVNCGHYLKQNEKRYVPMDEKKMKKIRWVIGVICIVAFVLFMIFSGKFLGE